MDKKTENKIKNDAAAACRETEEAISDNGSSSDGLWRDQLGKQGVCGGSNGYRVRLRKVKLQEDNNKLNKEIHVMHYPPGTSGWNKIEHRLLSYISINWRGKPLDELLTVINLIASTTSDAGLTVECISDMQQYEKGIAVSDEELSAVNIKPDEFHGEWNCIISPNM